MIEAMGKAPQRMFHDNLCFFSSAEDAARVAIYSKDVDHAEKAALYVRKEIRKKLGWADRLAFWWLGMN